MNTTQKIEARSRSTLKIIGIGTDTQIFKMESEASIEDLIDQQRSFFLPKMQRSHGISREYQYTSERGLGNWPGLTVIRSSGRGNWSSMPRLQYILSGQTHIAEEVFGFAQTLSRSWVSILGNVLEHHFTYNRSVGVHVRQLHTCLFRFAWKNTLEIKSQSDLICPSWGC